jgi:hypothetical protein
MGLSWRFLSTQTGKAKLLDSPPIAINLAKSNTPGGAKDYQKSVDTPPPLG